MKACPTPASGACTVQKRTNKTSGDPAFLEKHDPQAHESRRPQYWTIICDPGGMPGGTWTIIVGPFGAWTVSVDPGDAPGGMMTGNTLGCAIGMATVISAALRTPELRAE